ncbi:MAG: hypothetical protein Q7J56_00180, partial [Deltaproteobacteria bacterium]|nr:hypothetical protein [Deltaproteobacteria bacterium]
NLSETAVAGERGAFKSFQPFKSFEATHKFKRFKSFKPSNAFNRCSRVFFPGEAQGLGYFQIRSR